MKISSLQKGLVGHWTMSQDSLKGSLLADKTPYENDGTIYGATFSTDRKGKANSAMSFDGVDDYIDCGSDALSDILEEITISAWINFANIGNNYFEIVNKGNRNAKTGIELAVTATGGGLLRAVIGNGITIASPSYNISSYENQWIHVLTTYNSSSAKLYLNGLLVDTESSIGNINITSDKFYIGSFRGSFNFFNGSIDDVRIYNRALSQAEITLLYNSYNPMIKCNATGSTLKLYGGDNTIKSEGYIRVDKNKNNAEYFENPLSNLYGKTYFYVMQYQARNNGGVPQSTGTGLPWVNISQIDAKAKALLLGEKYHLMTNWEWMAIARDIEQVAENWTGGQVGSGMIKRGNVGIVDAGSYNGADPETGILNDKAILKLSNGEEIYHFSGNVWEWVDDTITQGEQYINFNQKASGWYEFNATDLFKVAQKLPYTEVGPKETYTTPSDNGLGKIYINTSNGSSANRAFLRGGNWGDGADAGVFALLLSDSPTSTRTSIGFRCAR